MRTACRPGGFTIVELSVVLVAIALLLAVVLPVTARVRGDAGVEQSMSNLVALGAANVLYSWDWNGRQVTWTRDDLGTADSMSEYNAAHGGCSSQADPGCHPHNTVGYGCESGLFAYWSNLSQHQEWAFEPLNFPTPDEQFPVWGTFRHACSNPFQDYLNGRYHDPIFYAPNDTVVIESVAPCLESMCGFSNDDLECNPGWSSYSFSPAAMFHPDVMRSNAAGGYQNPWSLDHGFEGPHLVEALYPALKTLMIEQHWLQGPPDDCLPAWPFNAAYGCEPYHFHHGLESTPAAMFYDLHVRLLPNAEALAADEQILNQTGGEDGLWHRGTEFGADGYYISYGFDGVPLSHHLLTTDGIRGRDTLAQTKAIASRSWDTPRVPLSAPDGDHQAPRPRNILRFTQEDEP